MYIVLDFYEIYFAELPVLVFEWLEIQVEIISRRNLVDFVIWTKDRLNLLKKVKNHWSRVFDFWYTSIVEGYIVEFTV